MQRLCSSCLRGLKMGLAPSFPIEMEPVHFEPAEIFTSTGKRRVEGEALQVVRCPENITEDIYRDIVNRRTYHSPHDHLEHINFEQLSEKYPNWTRSNISEFRIEFITNDKDKDSLLNYDEVSEVLNKLGDDSPTNVRFHCFVQTMKSMKYPELGNKVDFQDFLELCHLLVQVRAKEAGSSCEEIKLEASGGRTEGARATPSPEPRRSGRLLSPRTRRSATGNSSPRLSGTSADSSPACKAKPKTLCSCPLADISETEADARILRGKSGKGRVKSHDHVDNILKNHCVTPAFNRTTAVYNQLGNPETTRLETTRLEKADNTRYSSDHKVPNNRVT
ncbi:uncharacterized protein LOC129265155 [Lytechinus pictus]|uniref:uncharacterized protein LOC129265155 n=1 Tax=Lytechinus pictus TaxID=7653 RepID=UPI0030BA082C